MSNGFVLSIIFAVFGLVMAWLSLDLSCAHFDVAGMCRNLSESMSVKEIENLSLANCFRLADLSNNICGKIWTVSWFGVLFGITATCFGTKHAIEAYVNQESENENI
jgi:hypothetical protein